MVIAQPRRAKLGVAGTLMFLAGLLLSTPVVRAADAAAGAGDGAPDTTGSTDGSLAVLEDFAHREPIIRIVRNERNLGVCEAVTRGTRLARGEYLLYAAADDYILPGMIEKSLDLLRRHPAAGMSCGFGSTINEVTG